MGFNGARVDRYILTFLSDPDEKVFLCLIEDVKRER
jgi:hypothetical protein